MVRTTRALPQLSILLAITSLFFACKSGPETKTEPQEEPLAQHQLELSDCNGDCLQPPLHQAALLAHLIAEQARILAREDYKKVKAPRVTDVAYGPKPDGYLRDEEPITDPEGHPFEGTLNWHTVPFEPVDTEEIKDRAFRRRQVSGAHCFFARQPNRKTALFSVLVTHHPDRGDTIYLGGPNHPTTRLDTVPITDRQRQPLRISQAPMRCAFRDDQNILGTLILTFEAHRPDDPDGQGEEDSREENHHHAVFLINASNHLRPSGRTQTIERSTDPRSGESEEVLVQVLEYPAPHISFIGTYPELFDALTAAEEAIPPGRFKLRRDFIYPRMPFQAFIEGDAEEFCPAHATCAPPPEHLDVDVRPKIIATRKEQDERQTTDEADAEAEAEEEEPQIGGGPQTPEP